MGEAERSQRWDGPTIAKAERITEGAVCLILLKVVMEPVISVGQAAEILQERRRSEMKAADRVACSLQFSVEKGQEKEPHNNNDRQQQR